MATLPLSAHWERFVAGERLGLPEGKTTEDWATQLSKMVSSIIASGDAATFGVSRSAVVQNMNFVMQLCEEALLLIQTLAVASNRGHGKFATDEDDRLAGAKWTTLTFAALIVLLETYSHLDLVAASSPGEPESCGPLLDAIGAAGAAAAAGAGGGGAAAAGGAGGGGAAAAGGAGGGGVVAPPLYSTLHEAFKHLRAIRNKYVMHPSTRGMLYEVLALYRRRSRMVAAPGGYTAPPCTTHSLADVLPESCVVVAYFALLLGLFCRRCEMEGDGMVGDALPRFPTQLSGALLESGIFEAEDFPAGGPGPVAGGDVILYLGADHAITAVHFAMKMRADACSYFIRNRGDIAGLGVPADGSADEVTRANRRREMARFAVELTAAALYRSVVPGREGDRIYDATGKLTHGAHVGDTPHIRASLNGAYSHVDAALWGYSPPRIEGDCTLLAMPAAAAPATAGRLQGEDWDRIQAESAALAKAIEPLCVVAADPVIPPDGYTNELAYWTQATVVVSAGPPANYAWLWGDAIRGMRVRPVVL